MRVFQVFYWFFRISLIMLSHSKSFYVLKMCSNIDFVFKMTGLLKNMKMGTCFWNMLKTCCSRIFKFSMVFLWHLFSFSALWYLITQYKSLIKNITLSLIFFVSIKIVATFLQNCKAPFWFCCDQSNPYQNLPNKAL